MYVCVCTCVCVYVQKGRASSRSTGCLVVLVERREKVE